MGSAARRGLLNVWNSSDRTRIPTTWRATQRQVWLEVLARKYASDCTSTRMNTQTLSSLTSHSQRLFPLLEFSPVPFIRRIPPFPLSRALHLQWKWVKSRSYQKRLVRLFRSSINFFIMKDKIAEITKYLVANVKQAIFLIHFLAISDEK